MSALSLPPTAPTAPTDRTNRTGVPVVPPNERPRLRVVPDPTPMSSLAPSGPLQAWRRRVGAIVLLAALVLLVGQALAGPPASPQLVPASTATVVVQPGQTLWDVAGEHAPAEVSTDAYVNDLAELNGISNGAVDAWQVLRLPAA